MRRAAIAFLVVAGTAACGRKPPHDEPRPAGAAVLPIVVPGEVASPAQPGSVAAGLAVSPAGLVFMSWLEPGQAAPALRFSVIQGGGWSQPRTVAEGNLVVNWADRPALAPWGDGQLGAAWLELPATGGDGWAVRVATSSSGGKRWTQAVTPHRDGTATEHGMVSLVDTPEGLGIAWLDGREYASSPPESASTQLRWATLDASGTATSDETLLDARTCDCCPTAALRAGATIVVAYRDRSPENVRDIAVVRRVDGRWTDPVPVHADGWKMDGCPVNGPALARAGDGIAVAWYTSAGEPAVHVAFSRDEGATWGPPIRCDEEQPAGRVDLVGLPDG